MKTEHMQLIKEKITSALSVILIRKIDENPILTVGVDIKDILDKICKISFSVIFSDASEEDDCSIWSATFEYTISCSTVEIGELIVQDMEEGTEDNLIEFFERMIERCIPII